MKLNARTLVTAAILALFLPYAAYTVFGLGRPELATLFNEGIHDALMLVATALVITRAIRRREQRLAWSMIGAALAAYAVAEIYYYFVLARMDSPPYPSVCDFLWVAFYPLSYIGLVLLVRGRVREFQWSLWLDGLIAALAAAAIAAAVVFGAVAPEPGGSVAQVVVNLAFPLGDVILFAMVVAVYALAGRRPGRDWFFLGAGFGVFALADPVWLYQAAEGTYLPGHVLDLAYIVGALLMGVAAWQPSRTDEIQLTGLRRLLVPVGACLVGISIETYDHFYPVPDIALLLATALLVAITVRLALSFRENLRTLASSDHDARTDALTTLGNRRSLIREVEHRLAQGNSFVLAMYDLDGFKVYNDLFGHLAGDALLARLGDRLRNAAAEHGEAYRLGGDEFCVLIDPTDQVPEVLVELMATALSEHGDGFSVTASYGWTFVPGEASTCADALRLADRRMYAHKQGGRQSAGRQSTNVLLSALAARNPELGDHLAGVSELAEQVARRAGLGDAGIEEVRLGAELHDVGKMGLPDEILKKPGPLTPEEWAFVRRHTLIGERTLFAAPALASVATLVRSSHERWDGDGYPDGIAGDEIPFGSRIIAICDSFDAMMSDRPYRPAKTLDEALAEVERCAGSQFDPALVRAFCETIAARGANPIESEVALLPG
jgi:two-component system cell cycle response regulator